MKHWIEEDYKSLLSIKYEKLWQKGFEPSTLVVLYFFFFHLVQISKISTEIQSDNIPFKLFSRSFTSQAMTQREIKKTAKIPQIKFSIPIKSKTSFVNPQINHEITSQNSKKSFQFNHFALKIVSKKVQRNHETSKKYRTDYNFGITKSSNIERIILKF